MTIKDGVYYPFGYSEMSEGEYQAYYGHDDGDGDAIYRDELDAEIWLPPASLDEKMGYWLTKDKRVLKIVDMTTDHLKNAIHCFAEWSDHTKILELRKELAGRTP